jgi:hypothetical protein
MAKVEIKNVKSVLKAIETAFSDVKKKNKLYADIGEFSVERIQQETRKGKNLAKDGAPIKDTSSGTKNIKELIERGVIKMNPPQPLFFRSSKSQVTQTGRLVDSLAYKINTGKAEVEVSPSGSRDKANYTWAKTGKPVKFLNEQKHIETNKGLANDLAKRGFQFLGMDKKGVARIRRLVLDEIRRIIKNLR